MKIQTSAVLKTFEGADMKDASDQQLVALLDYAIDKIKDPADRLDVVKKSEELQQPITVRKALLRVLGAGLKDTDPEKLARLYRIAINMPSEGEFELSAEDVVDLKKAVGKYYVSPLLVGQLYDFLDPKGD